MELSISDDKTLEALEEVGLANAIAEGRKNEFVSDEEVFSIIAAMQGQKIFYPCRCLPCATQQH
jgi:hypothetical protein